MQGSLASAPPAAAAAARLRRRARAGASCRTAVRCGRGTVVCAASAQPLVRFAGVGSAVPKAVLTNDDLSKFVDTNDEWIATRTGIRERRILSGDETLTGLAADACRSALAMAGVAAEDVDMVIMCTSSPEDAFGGACLVQAAIGATRAVAFDLTAACSGFVLGLITAGQFIRAGGARRVLVVGADALSRHVDWRDRGTCILFGDGSGAVLVQAGAACDAGGCSLLGFDMNSDGAGNRHLTSAFCGVGGSKHAGEGASSTAAYANIHMAGQEVFKFAVRSVPATLQRSLDAAGMQAAQIDWLVMHQANKRILDAAAERLGIPHERVVSNLARYGALRAALNPHCAAQRRADDARARAARAGNTSAASVPIALDEAVRGGQVRAGDVVATAGFGAGLTWASALLRWG